MTAFVFLPHSGHSTESSSTDGLKHMMQLLSLSRDGKSLACLGSVWSGNIIAIKDEKPVLYAIKALRRCNREMKVFDVRRLKKE